MFATQELQIAQNVRFGENMILVLHLIRGQLIRDKNRNRAKLAARESLNTLETFCFVPGAVVSVHRARDGTASKNLLALTA